MTLNSIYLLKPHVHVVYHAMFMFSASSWPIKSALNKVNMSMKTYGIFLKETHASAFSPNL